MESEGFRQLNLSRLQGQPSLPSAQPTFSLSHGPHGYLCAQSEVPIVPRGSSKQCPSALYVTVLRK